MAYVLTIRGYSKADGKEAFYAEPFWWKDQEFKQDPRVKAVSDGVFLDYEAELSAEELGELHEHFKPYADNTRYDTELWQKLLKERLEALDRATKDGASQFSHFVAGLYEWSSGLS